MLLQVWSVCLHNLGWIQSITFTFWKEPLQKCYPTLVLSLLKRSNKGFVGLCNLCQELILQPCTGHCEVDEGCLSLQGMMPSQLHQINLSDPKIPIPYPIPSIYSMTVHIHLMWFVLMTHKLIICLLQRFC